MTQKRESKEVASLGEKGKAWAAKVWQAIVSAWTKLVDWVKERFHKADTAAEDQETVVLPAAEPQKRDWKMSLPAA